MGRQTRKKAVGQIDRLIAELDRNPRLDTVFTICKDLGVDDPIHWMNNVSPMVIDWWIAHYTLKVRRESEAYKDNQSFDPDEASNILKGKVG